VTLLPNDPDSNDPARRCTCGFRRFRDTKVLTEEAVQRWVFFDDTDDFGGMGSMPFGLYFGVGDIGGWGLLDGTLYTCATQRTCENCTRVRSSRPVSTVTLFGSYVLGGYLYVVTSDVVGTGCFSVRFEGPEGTFEVPLVISSESAQPLVIVNPGGGMQYPSPQGPAADIVLEARLPLVIVDGEYLMTFVDRCNEFEAALSTVFLEVDVIVLNQNDADLNGIPEVWLKHSPLQGSTSQPYSGAVRGIPFDYCEGVLEYDARFATLPAAQGWTHQAGGGTGLPGDFALVPGGALKATTPGSTNPSYWENDFALSAPSVSVAAYAVYQGGTAGGGTFGEGLDFQGLNGSNGSPYGGVRWTARAGTASPILTNLATSAEVAWANSEVMTGWQETAAERGSIGDSYVHNDGVLDHGTFHGTVGVAVADEIRARFGDVVGEGIPADYIRNYVVSAPGRFVRALFRAYTTVADPVVRLYIASDLDGTAETLARFLIRYGSADPFAIPTSTVGATVSFSSRNTIFELPFQLAGLTAGEPFWFTVERETGHADDRTEATVWFHQATVRGA